MGAIPPIQKEDEGYAAATINVNTKSQKSPIELEKKIEKRQSWKAQTVDVVILGLVGNRSQMAAWEHGAIGLGFGPVERAPIKKIAGHCSRIKSPTDGAC